MSDSPHAQARSWLDWALEAGHVESWEMADDDKFPGGVAYVVTFGPDVTHADREIAPWRMTKGQVFAFVKGLRRGYALAVRQGGATCTTDT